MKWTVYACKEKQTGTHGSFGPSHKKQRREIGTVEADDYPAANAEAQAAYPLSERPGEFLEVGRQT